VSADISERKRIEAALVERTRQLEAVRMVSEEIARELDLTRLLRLITRRAAELVGAASGVVWLQEPEPEGLVPWAWHGLADWVAQAHHPLGEGVVGEAARRREGFIVNDYPRSPYGGAGPGRLLLERGGVARILAEPLLYRDRLVGVITVHDHGGGRPFAEHDRALLAMFADQAAVAIENARLYTEAARERRAAQVIAELARTINASLDLRTILERVAEAARELGGADLARIAVHDEASGAMLLRHWTGTRWHGYHDALRVEPGKGSGGRVLLSGRPFRTENYAADPRITKDYIAGVAEEGVLAQLVVPIRRDDRIEGLLYVDRRSSRPFTDWEEATLTALADHAAVAIGNFRLLKRTEAARADAEAANRMKDEFLATLSHELRTPLNAVMGWIRLLAVGGLDAGTAARGLEAIERNARLQAQLIDDLLDVSRIVTGKLRVHVRTVALPEVVQAAVETVRPAAAARHIQLEITFEPSVGPVAGDPQRLQQVAWNLLSNAVKFTPPAGRIEVRLARVGTLAELSVRDTGQGIAPEFLPHVFDRFRQADSTTTRAHGGLGLGLAIVRHLVELHGGTVRAESPGPGQGATFTVSLPLAGLRASAGEVAPQEPMASERILVGVRVLVVDDQPDQRDLLATMLGRFGADVVTAESAAAARRLVTEASPDVLVCDIGMPGQDGLALIREVREQRPGQRVPAVALTAYARPEDREAAVAAGFAEHLAKPVEPDTLVHTIARLIRA
jgi:signal transduction histidine kinase/CheY-like chemotaxis protein